MNNKLNETMEKTANQVVTDLYEQLIPSFSYIKFSSVYNKMRSISFNMNRIYKKIKYEYLSKN